MKRAILIVAVLTSICTATATGHPVLDDFTGSLERFRQAQQGIFELHQHTGVQ